MYVRDTLTHDQDSKLLPSCLISATPDDAPRKDGQLEPRYVIVGQLTVKNQAGGETSGRRPALRAIMSAQGRTARENWVQPSIIFNLAPAI